MRTLLIVKIGRHSRGYYYSYCFFNFTKTNDNIVKKNKCKKNSLLLDFDKNLQNNLNTHSNVTI